MFGHHYTEEEQYGIELIKQEQNEEAIVILYDLYREYVEKFGWLPFSDELEPTYVNAAKHLDGFWTQHYISGDSWEEVKKRWALRLIFNY